MATSHYFNNFSQTKVNEQRMYEDLISESIRIHGHDIYYMPREDWKDTDEIFGENIYSKFERAYQMEMYIANVQGFEGDGDFFSKFGLEIRDTSNFVVARRTFEKYIPSNITLRPREGDLLYVPTFNKIFEIKYVEEELLFFARRGQKVPYLYELRAEAFRYAHEQINTGVEKIDEIEDKSVFTLQFTLSGSGNYNVGEIVYQGANLNYATASAKVSNWNPTNNTIQLINVKGDFVAAGNLRGVTSNTLKTISTTDTYGDYVYYDLFNNKDLQLQGNNFIDLSEINPFGMP